MADKQLAATKASKVWFHTHTAAMWPMEQSSILSAKFDYPEARQSISLLATAHDCETGFLADCETGSTILQLICLNCVYIIDRAEKLSDEKMS